MNDFVCPNCGSTESKSIHIGDEWYVPGYGITDNIEELVICTKCGAEMKEIANDSDELEEIPI